MRQNKKNSTTRQYFQTLILLTPIRIPIFKRFARSSEALKGNPKTKREEAALKKPAEPRKEKATKRSTMLIKVAKGRTYTDVLGKLRKETNQNSSPHFDKEGKSAKNEDPLSKVKHF